MKFQNDPVDVIVISSGNKQRPQKPLLFFCQGSLPQPVIKYDEKGLYPILPFDEQPFLDAFHIAIVAKPFIPVIADATTLGKDFTYYRDDKTQLPPSQYAQRNFLDYYVARNNFIIKQLARERWVDARRIVVVGHSEGATVAAKMAASNRKISHLIYAGGNPYGRILSMLAQARAAEDNEEGNYILDYWREVVENRNHIRPGMGDSPKTSYDFSQPQGQNMLQLDIPVLVSYGLKDWSAPYNDLLQVEAIRAGKTNIAFRAYPGLEHNFFGVDANGKPDNTQYHWEQIASDWREWLAKNP